MSIYGVSLLAICLLVGAILGQGIGRLMGIDANVGGVGIAMLLLLFLTNLGQERFSLKPMTASGITFWSSMYIPIVVAMAAQQNVVAALSGGWMALTAGVLAVVASFLLVPILSRLVKPDAS
ncbi:MAG: malonate transporter subunit MadL [Sphingorhabdus sp.]